MPIARLPDEDVEFLLTARRWCTPVVAELTVSVVDRGIVFDPGQYVLIQDPARSVPVRSYSVANAPRPDGTLTFLVTAVPGGQTSSWLTSGCGVGESVLVSGPYGSFVADPDHQGPTLHLAGGSGLAPIRSLLEASLPRSANAQAGGKDRADRLGSARHTLVFSARTPADVIDEDDWAELARQQPFDYVRTLTRVAPGTAPPPLGRVPDVLPTLLPDLTDHAVYIAGSPGFVDACTRAVEALGVRAGRLHTEEFYAEPVPWPPAADATAAAGSFEEEP